MKYLLLFLFLITFLVAGAATVYTKIENNGDIVYSDTPVSNGKTMEIQETISTVSTPQNTVQKDNSQQELQKNPKKDVYSKFLIISPKNQETFQNQREAVIEINLQPELQLGDKIQLVVDGTLYGSPSLSLLQKLGQLDRGMHQIAAAIIRGDQQIIQQSNTVTIYIHYARLGIVK